MKIIRSENELIVVLNNGDIINTSECTDDLFQKVMDNRHDESVVKELLIPEFKTKTLEAKSKRAIFEGINESSILTAKGQSMYMLDVSELSLPEDLVERILKAEREGDVDLLRTYINFWTLTSLNPDSRVRQNLFWFLDKYGMTISMSGLFVAYRNVHIKNKDSIISNEMAKLISSAYVDVKFRLKEDPADYLIVYNTELNSYSIMSEEDFDEINENNYNDEEGDVLRFDFMNSEFDDFDEFLNDHEEHNNVFEYKGNLEEMYDKLSDDPVAPIYTDGYTQTFNIKIGEVVSMPREQCDTVQENTCSRGLHVAGKDWLSRNYFGDVGMMVLVNPSDVVAVPPQDNYGKMRTAAYYPISIVDFDEDGNLIGENIKDGFEDNFIDKIVYSGERNRDDSNPYHIVIPEIPEIDKSKINDKLIKLAKQFDKIAK